MGMFDSFIVEIICPYSGERRMEELQTKQFACMLNTWKQGEEFTGMKIKEGVIEEVYGGCRCNSCKLWEDLMNRYNNHGCHGFGRGIKGDIFIEDFKVKGVINLQATDNELPNASENELKTLLRGTKA